MMPTTAMLLLFVDTYDFSPPGTSFMVLENGITFMVLEDGLTKMITE